MSWFVVAGRSGRTTVTRARPGCRTRTSCTRSVSPRGDPGVLLDAEAERREAELGVAHEGEQGGQVRDPRPELGQLGDAPAVGGERDEGRAIPAGGGRSHGGHLISASARRPGGADPRAVPGARVDCGPWSTSPTRGPTEAAAADRAAAAGASAFVEANGLRVRYDRVGAGPPLVLLHGASSTGREDFGAQLPRLARSFTCYLPDARGHAGTRLRRRAGPPPAGPRRRPRGLRRRPGAGDLPPPRVLDGRRHGARLRGRPAGPPAHARARGDGDRARAPDERDPPPCRRRAHRAPGSRVGRPRSPAATTPARARAPGGA